MRKTGPLLAIILALLAVPAIAMLFTEEVNWSLMDFVIMGLVLFALGSTYLVIISRATNWYYRWAWIVMLASHFLLFWSNGAVGIIGDSGNDLNSFFYLVPVINIVGALLVRGRPKGLSVVLMIVCLLLILIPLIAYLLDPLVIQPITFLALCVFVTLFGTSAWLFSKSAVSAK